MYFCGDLCFDVACDLVTVEDSGRHPPSPMKDWNRNTILLHGLRGAEAEH
jgi:hypothetical protein